MTFLPGCCLFSRYWVHTGLIVKYKAKDEDLKDKDVFLMETLQGEKWRYATGVVAHKSDRKK